MKKVEQEVESLQEENTKVQGFFFSFLDKLTKESVRKCHLLAFLSPQSYQSSFCF